MPGLSGKPTQHPWVSLVEGGAAPRPHTHSLVSLQRKMRWRRSRGHRRRPQRRRKMPGSPKRRWGRVPPTHPGWGGGQETGLGGSGGGSRVPFPTQEVFCRAGGEVLPWCGGIDLARESPGCPFPPRISLGCPYLLGGGGEGHADLAWTQSVSLGHSEIIHVTVVSLLYVFPTSAQPQAPQPQEEETGAGGGTGRGPHPNPGGP